jgi:hypothetical protein
MRRRVSSPAALSAALRASKPSRPSLLMSDLLGFMPDAWAASHHIKISLYL